MTNELKIDAELKPVPNDLSKLSDIVKYNAVKKKNYSNKIKNIVDNLATNSALNTKRSILWCKNSRNGKKCYINLLLLNVINLRITYLMQR